MLARFAFWRWAWWVCLGMLCACGEVETAAPTASWQVKAIGVMERFSPYEPVLGTDETAIFAARNEYEGFQLVVTAGVAGARGVQVSIAPLRHPDGGELPVAVFRERYVPVTTPSPFSPYPPQRWPDILLPATTGNAVAAEYRAFPHDLQAGENLPVWAEVYVPVTAKAGEYSGAVTVTADGVPPLQLPVKLTVWDFALPSRSPLRTVFGTNWYRVAKVYGLDRSGNNADDNGVIRRYNDFLLDHYLSPESFWDATPQRDAQDRPDVGRTFAGLGTVTENMRHYMQEKQASVYTYAFGDTYPFDKVLGENRGKASTFMAAYAAWCGALAGEQRRCYTDPSFLDEPNSAEDYAEIRRWGAFFDAVPAPRYAPIHFQITETPVPDDPAWGNLHGAADVWVARFYDFWKDVDYLGNKVTGQRQAAGDELWAYTGLVVDLDDYKRLNPKADALKGHYPPVWQMDYPAINYRLPPWLFHHYGVTGLVYWDTLEWFAGADVWRDAASFRSEDADQTLFNGDGLLVYPGRRGGVGFDGPVPSLRLKWVRDSVEDYMYADLLVQAGEGAFLQQQVARFARHFGDWDNDPALLMQVRQALGERLHGRVHGP